MRVAVFGAKGLLGSAIVHEFRIDRGAGVHEVFDFDRAALDLTDPDLVALAVKRVDPEVLINCVAYNAVDAAEEAAMAAYGLRRDDEGCRRILSNLEANRLLGLCPLDRLRPG